MQLKKQPVSSSATTVKLRAVGGVFFWVSVEDYAWVSKFTWRVSRKGKKGYIFRRIRKNKKTTTIRLHREIMKTPPHLECHHRDLNPYNNSRDNLENLTHHDHLIAHFKA